MTINANEDKKSPDKHTGAQNGVLSKSQNPDRVIESKVNASNEQQQPPKTVICWERFLHVRSIRVLLVENDDSTRHVVTALLRNCHYEVLEAANGAQAWNILADLSNHIDLVLTEVVMPCLSGIDLLCKITTHKSRKNIPVIMMSSHDSMGIVFQCLSKGAVDFLLKPIRKNELKNLWQHIWRRCHSSSGSGSESGTRAQVKSKSSQKSNSGSEDNNGENNGSNEHGSGDGSADGSAAQSSWTKQAVEVDSGHAMFPTNQVAECHDRTCAQVIRSNLENRMVAREGHDQNQPEYIGTKDKDLEKTIPRNAKLKSQHLNEIPPTFMCAKRMFLSESDCNTTNKGIELNSTSKINNYPIDEVQEVTRSVQDDRYVLRHSAQSAFSRYNASSDPFKSPNGMTRSSCIVDQSIEVAKGDIKAHSPDHIVNQYSNGLSNINTDVGSTTNKLLTDPTTSAFRPVNNLRYTQQEANLTPKPNDKQTTGLDLNLHTSHHNHHPLSKNDESSIKKLSGGALPCESTNVLGGPMEKNNPMDYSLNRSGSGSNHGSNVQNESCNVNNSLVTNGESDVGQVGKSGMTLREAALNKFRQKRKERCFAKKVRYHNRQKLAEQRPRVRGQFVKQTGVEVSDGNLEE